MRSRQSTDEDGDEEDPDSGSPEQNRKLSVYEQIEQLTGIPHDSFWEYTFEGCSDREELASAMEKYGASLREFSEADKDSFKAEHEALRECFMRRMIAEAAAEDPDRNIVVVTGAFHTAAVKEAYSEDDRKKTDAALAGKQNLKDCNATLMPYSYYRLSEHSGYGAGAKAPGYFEILWRCRNASGGAPGGDMAASEYLTRVAAYQRLHGGMASSAQVIEALRLAKELAAMNGGKYPALADLRSSAVTCIGEGSFAEIATAVASTEIGTRIGQMPEGTVCTSVQEDFLRQLKVLKLERFRSSERQDLELDLRENLRVKSQEAAFLDLNRSFFLHRMSVLQNGKWHPTAYFIFGWCNTALFIIVELIIAAVLAASGTGGAGVFMAVFGGFTLLIGIGVNLGYVFPRMKIMKEIDTYIEEYKAELSLAEEKIKEREAEADELSDDIRRYIRDLEIDRQYVK